MSDKKNKKKSPFSIYWIYAAIGVAIIGVQLFMSSGSDVELKNEDVVVALREVAAGKIDMVDKEEAET